jgi:four helix bundle protein
MGDIKHFKDMVVWQRSHQLFLDIVKDVEQFYKNAISRVIVDQIIRSIGSISSNIAEGFNALTTKQYISYLDIARRSAAESENWFYKLRDIGYLPQDVADARIKECVEISRMLYGLMNSLRKNRLNR